MYGFEHRGSRAVGARTTRRCRSRASWPARPTSRRSVFGERRKETSWAHQIATAAVFTSPLLVYGGHPQSLLDNPAVEI